MYIKHVFHESNWTNDFLIPLTILIEEQNYWFYQAVVKLLQLRETAGGYWKYNRV